MALPVDGFMAGGGGFLFLFHSSRADCRCSFNVYDSSRRWLRAIDLAALPMFGAARGGGRWTSSVPGRWLRQAGVPTAARPGWEEEDGPICNFPFIQGAFCKRLGCTGCPQSQSLHSICLLKKIILFNHHEFKIQSTILHTHITLYLPLYINYHVFFIFTSSPLNCVFLLPLLRCPPTPFSLAAQARSGRSAWLRFLRRTGSVHCTGVHPRRPSGEAAGAAPTSALSRRSKEAMESDRPTRRPAGLTDQGRWPQGLQVAPGWSRGTDPCGPRSLAAGSERPPDLLAEFAMAPPVGYTGFGEYSMFGFPGSFTRFWMMEEEDDDMHFLLDDDEEEAFLYGQIVPRENSRRRRRRRSDGPPKEIRPRWLVDGDLRIRLDYFDVNCVYNDRQFRERFRMRRHVVQHIVDVVEASNPDYFSRKRDCCGKEGLSALQKCVAALRILAYGLPAHAVNEYVRIGASTARKTLGKFCKAVIKEFGPYYLRAPTNDDVARLLEENKQRGFPGMLGSIDCMHWEWRMCPTAWKGMFTGRGKHPSMILEAIASHDLHIWHAYFGMPGSNNDINVLQRSPVFSNYLRGHSTPVEFEVNGNTYNMGYYLGDGIYPEWPSFVKSIRHPMEAKTQHFSKRQESARKDIERAFGVLRARFAVVRGPAYGWHPKQIKEIMMCCIILHNMIVEDEGEHAGNTNFSDIGYIPPVYENNPDRESFVAARHRLQNKNGHFQLQHDLIEHNWMLLGSNNVYC